MGISASVARKFFIEIPTVGKSGEFDLKYPNCNSVTIGERNQNSNGGPNRVPRSRPSASKLKVLVETEFLRHMKTPTPLKILQF